MPFSREVSVEGVGECGEREEDGCEDEGVAEVGEAEVGVGGPDGEGDESKECCGDENAEECEGVWEVSLPGFGCGCGDG